MYASLDWLPSLVGGGLAGCGFCLVWYRLRRLERLYRTIWLGDEGSQDAPRCRVCHRWLFAETLAAFERLDDKREQCPSCGGYNGPKPEADDDTQKSVVVSDDAPPPKDGDATDPPAGCQEPKDDDDPPPPPVPVAIAPAPSLPELAVVREDDPPPIPVAMQEPAPSLLRLYRSHPEHCDCDVCRLDRRIAMDVAQDQTLGMVEDLGFIRQGLKTLRLTLIDEIDGMNRRIAKRLDAET